jgi:hypothetical protein
MKISRLLSHMCHELQLIEPEEPHSLVMLVKVLATNVNARHTPIYTIPTLSYVPLNS